MKIYTNANALNEMTLDLGGTKMLKQVQHDRKRTQCHSELVSESQCKIIKCVCIKFAEIKK